MAIGTEVEERIKALAEYLEQDISTVTMYDQAENIFEESKEGRRFYVLTEDEAREKAEEDVKNFIRDAGVEYFAEDFKDWIYSKAIDRDWFDDALKESEELYVDDIEKESSDTCENRLIEELYDAGLLDDSDFEVDYVGDVDYSSLKDSVDIDQKKEDYVEYLINKIGDSVEYFRDEFGEREFNNIVNEHNLIDEDRVAEEAVDWDGVAHFLASYDDEERELPDDYYAYRID